jgi:hypothetical protein
MAKQTIKVGPVVGAEGAKGKPGTQALPTLTFSVDGDNVMVAANGGTPVVFVPLSDIKGPEGPRGPGATA